MNISRTVEVGQGEQALFECAVEANPITATTIRWERRPTSEADLDYDMASRTKTTAGLSTSKTKSALMLTVLNATAEDSGVFVCVADNGLGDVDGESVARNETFLLVRRKYST